MKIKSIQKFNFTSQIPSKYIIAQNSQKSPVQAQAQSTVAGNIFNQFAYQLNTSQMPLDAPEITLEKTKLKNNISLLVDTNTPNKPSGVIALHTFDKKGINPSAYEVLSKMLFGESSKIGENNNAATSFIKFNNNTLQCELDTTEANFFDTLNSSVNIILHPDLSQDNFNKAKNDLLNDSKSDDASQKAMEVFCPRNYSSSDELSKVTLDDVKKAHETVLKNSQMTVALSLPNEFYQQNRDKIVQTFEQSFLQMKDQTDSAEQIKNIHPIDKDYRFEDKSDDRAAIERFYVIDGEQTYKDSVKTSVLTALIEGRIKSTLPQTQACEILVDSPAFESGSYIDIYLNSEGKKYAASDMEKYLNNSVQTFFKTPISKEELDEAKKQTAEKFAQLYKISSYRAISLLQNYPDGTISIAKDKQILNEITLDEMNKFAIQHLLKPSSTAVIE